jgi:hypothetical protein
MENIWLFLKNLQIKLSDDLAILLLSIHPKEWKTGTQTDIYTPVFIVPLFIIAKCL